MTRICNPPLSPPRCWQVLAAAALLGLAANLSAYAAFDEVMNPAPTWTTLPGAPQVAAGDAAYRVRRCGVDRIAIELRNRNPEAMQVVLRLPGYLGDQAIILTAEPGVTTVVERVVDRLDRDLTEAAVRFSRLVRGEAELRLRPPPGDPPIEERAFAVTAVRDHPGFRADLLAYSAKAVDQRTVDLHFRNASTQALHFDFRIVGCQPARDGLNPRIHLLPGSLAELLITVDAVGPEVGAAIIDVWRVRVGADSGEAIGDGPLDFHRYPEHPQEWPPIVMAETVASFDPRAVLLRFTPDTRVLELCNRGSVAVGLTVHAGTLAPPHQADMAPEATLSIALAETDGARQPFSLSQPRVAGRAPVIVPATPVVPPRNHLIAGARWPSSRFSPRVLAYAIARAGGQAALTVVNTSAADLHAEFALAGYQDASTPNPRLHLPAGASATLSLRVLRSDARLALARLEIWDVRVGADQGDQNELLCTSPGR